MRAKEKKRENSLASVGQESPAPATIRRTLKELVRDITPENRHEESDFGAPVGREILQ